MEREEDSFHRHSQGKAHGREVQLLGERTQLDAITWVTR